MIDIEAIKARCEAATPEPWRSKIEYFGTDPEPERISVLADGEGWGLVVSAPTCGGERSKANIRFIAHARQDIPSLIAEVERLRKRLKEANELLDDAHHQLTMEELAKDEGERKDELYALICKIGEFPTPGETR